MAQVSPEIIATIKKFIDILEKNDIHIEQAVLFGSYARGTADEWSDIDLALVSDCFVGNRMVDRKTIRPHKFKVSSAIEPLPYRPEDFTADNPFVKEILSSGVPVVP